VRPHPVLELPERGDAFGTPSPPYRYTAALLNADIYSFGVLLWELLSGEYPWMGESNVQIIYK
jgi:hypothetical protein